MNKLKHIRKQVWSRFAGAFLILALALSIPAAAMAMQYGATGPYGISTDTFGDTTVLYPVEAVPPVPVMFFTPGFGSTSWTGYRSLLTHIASQGVAVVYVTFMGGSNGSQRYDIIWNGFQQAANRYATQFDMARVGFIGHSYGGGAAATMAYRGLVEEGWGSDGACIYILAPYKALEVTNAQLGQMPAHANFILQAFNQDTTAIPSIGLDLYAAISKGVPLDRRAFYRTDGQHSEPSDRAVNQTDSQGIHKPLDALMDYSFDLDRPEDGRVFALVIGGGDHYQTTVYKDPTKPESDPINQPPADDPVTYQITARAGSNGAISPSGTTTVNEGEEITYTVTPDTGYAVSDVTVDGLSMGALTTYTLTAIDSDHTITATFAAVPSDGGTGGSRSWLDWWLSRRRR